MVRYSESRAVAPRGLIRGARLCKDLMEPRPHLVRVGPIGGNRLRAEQVALTLVLEQTRMVSLRHGFVAPSERIGCQPCYI